MAALVALYDMLVDRHPTMGALVGRAVAQGAHFGAARGHALLDAIAPDAAERYQPYWAARLHLARQAGNGAEAARARAIALCRDPAVIRYLERA
jgi:RNA polymerase sigma-70 factor, ECF subfamily